MIVEEPKLESFEGPTHIDIDNVQHWCRHTKTLSSSQKQKALKFVKYDCIRYIGKAFDKIDELKEIKNSYNGIRHAFICLPLNKDEVYHFYGNIFVKKPYGTDYNISEYIIYKRPDGIWECNCQGCQKRVNEKINDGVLCSHILALFYCFKMRIFGLDEGAKVSDLEPDEDEIRGGDHSEEGTRN